MTSVSERFLRYVGFPTASDEFSETCPSTPNQKVLGAALVEEMLAMGIQDAYMDEDGYVYGTVPGDPSLPTIGLIAHMDTSPDASCENIRARIVEYHGGDVLLNEEQNIYLRESEYESLKNHHGKHLIVTDGTTLLGADDKAGIAEILTAAEYLLTTKMNHATLKIGFTPDEEIGRGADKFNVKAFAADYAYTVDGGAIGEMEYENFNAAGAKVEVKGLTTHPGEAKDKMINAALVAMEFDHALPAWKRPEHTCDYDGFYHLMDINGDCESCTMNYIVREADGEKFEAMKAFMKTVADQLNELYGEGTVTVTLKKQYDNMAKTIEPHMHIIENARKAITALGGIPKSGLIRGGTDGASLSYMGIPCPNLGTGSCNHHGVKEFANIQEMEKCVDLVIEILKAYV